MHSTIRRLSRSLALAGVLALLGPGCILKAADASGNAPASAVAQSGAPVATAPAAATDSTKPKEVEASVVKILSTVRYPDLTKPWTKQEAKEISGSGVVIAGKRILTNAHVVAYAGDIQVQGNESGDKYTAHVEAIAPDADMAILKLEDESFFATRPPLQWASSLPSIKDTVMAYGFPTGGTTLSITKGIVSRIEFAGYNYQFAGLRIQIDAAINPGNSGGPAMVDNKMVGIAFAHLNGAQNIGYIIPCEEIDLFLKSVAGGNYPGKPAIHDEFVTLQNPALRSYLHVAPSVEGAVVNRIDSSDPAYPLRKWDVVTRIGDTPVDDECKIKIGENLRVGFTYMVQKIVKDGKVPLTILRDGKEIQVQVPVEYERQKLIPFLRENYPSYFVYGPISFTVATEDLINGVTSNGAGGVDVYHLLSFVGSPLVTMRSSKPTKDLEQLVVISSPFFPHRLTKGYDPAMGRVVERVNGVAIKSLRHLVEVLRDAKSDYIVIELSGNGAESLVFKRKEMIAATDGILSDNGIRAQGSTDMMEVWNAK